MMTRGDMFGVERCVSLRRPRMGVKRLPLDPKTRRPTPASREAEATSPDLGPTQDQPDPSLLFDLARMPMPFGRYKGRLLIDLPEPYVVWFRKQGFPRGRLGELMGLLYEIKANGLEPLLEPFRTSPAPSSSIRNTRTRRPTP